MTRATVRAIAAVAAAKHGLDPLVLCAIWWLESSWRPDAVNVTSYATGLGGVLSRESAAIYGSAFAGRPTIAELKDPATNADWSASILAANLKRTGGDLRAAVKLYSGGWTQAGDAAFLAQYWAPFQRKLAELQALEVSVATDPESSKDIAAAKWHAEEAVRQIEATIRMLQEARQRLLDQTIHLLSG